jgi:cytidine deaminase
MTMTTDNLLDADLFDYAKSAQRRSYSPYSKFAVGCALIDENYEIHTGCNVENASYPACFCAEQSAIASMISWGGRQCKIVMVVNSSDKPVFPCGCCLQVLREFGENMTIMAVNNDGTKHQVSTIKELYPQAFTEFT